MEARLARAMNNASRRPGPAIHTAGLMGQARGGGVTRTCRLVMTHRCQDRILKKTSATLQPASETERKTPCPERAAQGTGARAC